MKSGTIRSIEQVVLAFSKDSLKNGSSSFFPLRVNIINYETVRPNFIGTLRMCAKVEVWFVSGDLALVALEV
jgi:hypothetical protein